MKTKLKTKLICLIACLAMLIGSTICVSAEENAYYYSKADGTIEVRTGALPTVDDNGLPVFYKVRQNVVDEVSGITPAGNLVYGSWTDLYTPEQIALLYGAIDAAGITNEMPKYDKAVAINNYICSVFTYDMGRGTRIPYADGLIALQMGGSAVCAEYSDLYQTMCQAVGIECEVVEGLIGNVAHGWNAVYIDGKEYFVDSTWNDTGDGPMDEYLMSETNWPDHKFVYYKWQTWNGAAAVLYELRMRDVRNYGPDDLVPMATEEERQEMMDIINQIGPLNWGATQVIIVNGQPVRVND